MMPAVGCRTPLETMKIVRLDHADIRVPSIAAVESFYDALLPLLGLSRKTESYGAADGEWYEVDSTHPRNVIEYHTPIVAGSAGCSSDSSRTHP